ncbi:MAG: type II secretion system F family protein [Actinomycetota bacterium]|nr:type II secretion system F family protein [Actinomycetota bacterium]
MHKTMALVAAGIVLALGLSPATAAERATIADAERSDGRITFTVSTPGGPLLTSGDFDVTINGLATDGVVAIADSSETSPGGVALVVDSSGSMEGRPIAEAKKAITSFVADMASTTQLALVPFASEASIASRFTDDHSRIVSAVRSLTASGETALYDAVITAAELVKARPPQHRNIVLLSDGADTASAATLDAAVEGAKSAQATVFAVALESPEFSADSIRALATETGGRLFRTADSSKLSDLFESLATELVSSYTVSVRDPDPGASLVEVEVSVHEEAGTVTGSKTFRLMPAPSAAGNLFPSLMDIPLPVLLLVVFLAAGLLALITSEQLRARRSSPAQRVMWYADDGSEQVDSEALINAAVLKRAQEFATQVAGRTGHLQRLERAIEVAGMRWHAGEVLVISGVVAFIAGLLAFSFGGVFLAFLLFLVGAATMPVIVKIKAARRRSAFYKQLPDVLLVMGGALRAGYSLQQAIGAVGEDVKPPASEEFRRTMAEVRLGNPLDVALKALAERVAIVDFQWTVLAIEIQREVGGNLAEVLETISETIRERERLRGQLKALTAEGRLSAVVLGVLPFLMAGFLLLTNPGYLQPLFNSAIGLLMIAGSAFMMTIGFFWMRKIIRIEV